MLKNKPRVAPPAMDNGTYLSDFYNIPPQIQWKLHSTVSHYIRDGQWNIPIHHQRTYPTLLRMVENTIIPLEQRNYELLWSQADTGKLILKQVYSYFNPRTHDLFWANLVWNISITPSKSMLMWRYMHNKLPTYNNLLLRSDAPSIPSICNFKLVPQGCWKRVITLCLNVCMLDQFGTGLLEMW
jgi:hypothetical protein